MGRTYVAKCKPQRYYIDADGNIVRPSWEGGGVISNIGELVRPSSEEEARKSQTLVLKEEEDIPLDEESKKAIELLKAKGLL